MSSGSQLQPTASQRVIVQCCHLPHFFFAAERLRAQSPQESLDGIVLEHPQVGEFLPKFQLFDDVFRLNARRGQWIPCSPAGSSGHPLDLVFPLLTRGYGRIKRTVAGLPHTRLWEMDYEGRLRPLSRGRLFRSTWQALHPATPDFVEYLKRFPHSPLGKRVLVLHSADKYFVQRSRNAWEKQLPKSAQVQHLERVRWRDWGRLRRRRFDAAAVFFAGEPGYWKLKFLPLLLRLRQILVINENGDAFYLDRRSWVRFVLGRLRHGVSLSRPRLIALFIQTENRRHCDYALRRLRREIVTRQGALAVLCPERERDHFQALPEVDRVISYGTRVTDAWKAYREVLRYRPGVISAIFSGRPVFRKQKLLFLLMADRRRLAFNASLDCYWVTPRTAHRLWRTEPLLFPESSSKTSTQEVLLIQTESEDMTTEAIRALASEKVSGGSQVSVLCSHGQAARFRPLPEVNRVYTYHPSDPRTNLRLLRRLWRVDRDILAAIYSGRPVFRLQKILLFLLPARNRLVFNENLDCFYLRRRQVANLLRLPGWAAAGRRQASWVRLWWTQLAKCLLYIPRFAFLMGWLSWEKLRRARRSIQ